MAAAAALSARSQLARLESVLNARLCSLLTAIVPQVMLDREEGDHWVVRTAAGKVGQVAPESFRLLEGDDIDNEL